MIVAVSPCPLEDQRMLSNRDLTWFGTPSELQRVRGGEPEG